jgi:hypothetical protein
MPTTTTTKLQDFLGRWLVNATPGTSQATDFLGRKVIAGDKDFVGRNLGFSNPSGWITAHAYTVGQTIRSTSGAILQCSVAGTSAATEPTAPASVGGQASDGSTLRWVRLH